MLLLHTCQTQEFHSAPKQEVNALVGCLFELDVMMLAELEPLEVSQAMFFFLLAKNLHELLRVTGAKWHQTSSVRPTLCQCELELNCSCMLSLEVTS